MKWTTTTGLILATCASALWVNRLVTPRSDDPSALVAQLEAERASGQLDQRQALRRLTQAIDSPGGLEDPLVARELLRARASLYRTIGALGSAREDLERVLATFGPGDPELELEVAELMADDGQTEAALLRVRGLVSRGGLGAESTHRALTLIGHLEATTASKHRERAITLCRKSLDERGGQRSAEIVTEVSARGVSDPRSAELLSELRAIFRAHETAPLTEVLDLVALASAATKAAVTAFASSMELEPTAEAATEVAGTLAAVGRVQEAGDLMLAARAVPEIGRSPIAMAKTLELLDLSARLQRVNGAFVKWDFAWGGDLEFYRAAAAHFLRANLLGATNLAARGLLRTGAGIGRYWGSLFLTIANIRGIDGAVRSNPDFVLPREHLQRQYSGLVSLARNVNEVEPYTGARIDAWFVVATAARLLGHDEDERVALSTGLLARPSEGADHWLRLAELESRSAVPAWERIEQRLTMALDQGPARTSEILARWTEAGDRALASDGLSLAEVIAESRISPDGHPLRRVGPSVRWRVAEAHRREGRTFQARDVAEQLLAEYAQLVPALDTLIEAQMRTSPPRVLADLVLRRIELAGVDEWTDTILARLPLAITGPSVLRAIRAVPDRFGLVAAAELALAEGEIERAADLLERVTSQAASPALLRLRGEVRLRARRLAPAGSDFDALLARGADVGPALRGAVAVRLGTGDRAGAETLLDRAPELGLTTEETLDLVDLLLQNGELGLAQRVLVLLDGSVESRTEDFYRALVLHAVASRDDARLREAMARAEAYLEDGTVQFAELVLNIRDRNWLALPDIAKQLRAVLPALTPLDEACLSLLEERIVPARKLAERSSAASPSSVEWALVLAAAQALEGEPFVLPTTFGASAGHQCTQLLLGTRSGRRDPRETLGLLLLLEREEWWPWLDRELEALEEQRIGRMWALWLQSQLDRRRGEVAPARARIEALLRSFADFAPAWQARLAAIEREHSSDPLATPLLEARVARQAVLREGVLHDPVEVALARASQEALAGEDAKAIFELGRTLLRERRGDFQARFTLGALLMRIGQHGLAVEHLREAAATAPPEARGALADRFVEALVRAADPTVEQRGAIDPGDLPARLEEAVRLFPTDPLVSCAYVRHGSTGTPDAPQRTTLARLELARLRRESGLESLEAMRPGSARAWVALTLEVAPELARELIELELGRQPGNVDHWELAASIAEQFGDHGEAEALYRVVLAIEQRPAACLALAERLIRSGAPADQVIPLIVAADRRIGGAQSARSRVLVADLRSRLPNPPYSFVVGELEAVWGGRANPAASVPRTRVGFSLVTTCLQWADGIVRQREQLAAKQPNEVVPLVVEDGNEAELATKALAVLAELEPMIRDDGDLLALLQCYRGIAQSLVETEQGSSTAMR